jgi:hypothetical protein
MIKKSVLCFMVVIIAWIGIQSCKTYNFRSNYKDVNSLNHATANLLTIPFLKAHLKNGDICILKGSWSIDPTSNSVIGNGNKYDFNRKMVFEGTLKIPVDSVSIFETNTKIQNPEQGRITALTILSAVDVILGVICLTNPKACFGSCPTFYINENDNFHYADAEAFSEAIRPSTEYSDIDALNNEQLYSGSFSITMKNEALETHCVRDIKLLAYPRQKGERIFHSPENDFYLCRENYALSEAKADEGDITALLNRQDRKERFSCSEENNLSSKEEIYLHFDNLKETENLGLILNFRQTLMTTYLVYSAFGYMGDEIGDIMTKMERTGETKEKVKNGIKKELGKIDVYNWNDLKNTWEFQDGFYEVGPIAINKQLIPLQNLSSGAEVRLKLVLNKGYWRLDYAGLTRIKEKVEPVQISPAAVLNKGIPDNQSLGDILNPDRYLISMPGSEYRFSFRLPEQNTDYELFLYSKGYYLEWMREHWIKDKDLVKLWQMVNLPKKYLRDEAKNYKLYETTMEQQFWESKIDTKTFVYHEN